MTFPNAVPDDVPDGVPSAAVERTASVSAGASAGRGERTSAGAVEQTAGRCLKAPWRSARSGMGAGDAHTAKWAKCAHIAHFGPSDLRRAPLMLFVSI